MPSPDPAPWILAAAEDSIAEVVYIGSAKERKKRKDQDVERNAAIIAKHYAEAPVEKDINAERVAKTPPQQPQQQSAEATLRHALEESVKLQSHYAKLLNIYDGGIRKEFANAQVWLDRLAKVESHD